MPPTHKLQTRSGLLEYVLSGNGPAHIVLLSGAGVTLESWHALYPPIERIGTVFAWNRFGVSGSGEPQRVQNGALVIASLRELLVYAGVAPPYVLVGHSLGGLHANLFARLHPQETAAVLFLESTHPRDRELLCTHEGQVSRALSKVFATPEDEFEANLHAELEAAADTAQAVEAAGSFPPVPLTVVTGGIDPPRRLLSPQAVEARRAHQQELARLSPHGEQVIAPRSGHFPQVSEPDLVLDALRGLVARACGTAP